MSIDSHVHLRDGPKEKQREKETVKHGLEVARDSGVDAVFDMPNTDPPIMTLEDIRDRLRLARGAGVPEVFYGLYIGVTADMEQVKQAVRIVRDFPQVVGMKLYAGHSTGDLGVIELGDQSKIYETLSDEGYDGVLAVHCEKESEMDGHLWDYRLPVSHCFARPEKAEVESVRDQMRMALVYGFPGKLHIVHVSSPDTVELIDKMRGGSLDISCGICPHHFIFDYNRMQEENGINWKMNPPLRKQESKDKMFNYLKTGRIDWIETDHTPHTLAQKVGEGAASGITGLERWPMFMEYLRFHEFSEDQIERITFTNVRDRFGIDIDNRNKPTRDRRGDYGINFYDAIDREIGYSPVT